jgi:1-acyl-sn-glycerol-3-phosphate acyltransferase
MENTIYQKICYKLGWELCNILGSFCFDPKIQGKENIPKESAILVANHATNLDGLLISMFINKQIHFWIQYEDVFEKREFLFYSIGEIPVKVKENDRNFWKHTTLDKSLYLLENTDDFIGIFPEGPTIKKKKIAHRGAVNLACKYNEKNDKIKGIVPVGLYVSEKYKRRLENYGRKSGFAKTAYHLIMDNFNDKIPYYALFGKPIQIKNCNSKEQKEIANYALEQCNDLVKVIENSSSFYI